MVELVTAFKASDGTLHESAGQAEAQERKSALVHELAEWLAPEADLRSEHAKPLAENLMRDWEILGRKTVSSRMSDAGRTDAFVHKGTDDKVYWGDAAYDRVAYEKRRAEVGEELKRWLCHRASWTPFALSEGLLQDFKIEPSTKEIS